MKKFAITIGILVGAVIIGGAIFMMFSSMKEVPESEDYIEPTKYVKTDIVKYGDFNFDVTGYGKLYSKERFELFSEVGGTMLKATKEFKEGVTFIKGETICKIDDTEARLNLYAQKSDFLNALTKILPDIKTDFPDSHSAWNSYLEEFSIKEDLSEIPEPKTPQEKYFLAGRNIFKMFYSIKNLEFRLTKYELKAPFSGTVTMSMIEPGTLVRPGQKLGDFTGLGLYELELSLSAKESSFLDLGMNAKVTSSESDGAWNGKVVRIGSSIDPSTQTVTAYLHLSGKGLKNGMYMKASLQGKEIKNIYKIPRRAVLNNTHVNVIKDSRLDKTEVELVAVSGDFAYIRGMEEGTEIIIEPIVGTPVGAKVESLSKK